MFLQRNEMMELIVKDEFPYGLEFYFCDLIFSKSEFNSLFCLFCFIADNLF